MLPEGFACVLLSDGKTLAVFHPEGKVVVSEQRQFSCLQLLDNSEIVAEKAGEQNASNKTNHRKFQSHENTVIDLSPGVTVLSENPTGANRR